MSAGSSRHTNAMNDQEEGYLTGQLLIAMPGMADPRFARTVVYVCAHNEEGAMGGGANLRYQYLLSG